MAKASENPKQKSVEVDPKVTELQKQVELLNQQIEEQKTSDASQRLEEARQRKTEQDKKLTQEADIKKALTKEGVDIDDLTPTELLSIVGDAFEQAIDAKATLAIQQADNKYDEVKGELTKVTNYLIKKEASDGVQNARSKYKDFDDFKEDMSVLFQQYPGMNPDDAYILAKSRKAGATPPKSEVETERPTSFATRTEKIEPTGRQQEVSSEPKLGNRRALRELINAGVEKALAAKSNKGM